MYIKNPVYLGTFRHIQTYSIMIVIKALIVQYIGAPSWENKTTLYLWWIWYYKYIIKTTQPVNVWKKNTPTADSSSICASMRQNGGQRGQSVIVPLNIVIRHWKSKEAPYFLWITWWWQSIFLIFKISSILGHAGGHLGVKSVISSLS